VRDVDVGHVGALPSASGGITRLACAHVKHAGIELEPLLKKAVLTHRQIEDPAARLRVRDQINFLNLAADALRDDLLGFHLAQPADLRELGALYYVLASSETMGEALRQNCLHNDRLCRSKPTPGSASDRVYGNVPGPAP